MVKTINKNISKSIAILLTLVILLAVPAKIAQAATCPPHNYWNTGGTYFPMTYTHVGPNGPCTITETWVRYYYTCLNGCGAGFPEDYPTGSVYHSACGK